MKTKSRNKRVALLTSTLIIVLCGAMGYLAVPNISADTTSGQTVQEQIKKSKMKNTSLGVLVGIIIVVIIAAIKGCFPC